MPPTVSWWCLPSALLQVWRVLTHYTRSHKPQQHSSYLWIKNDHTFGIRSPTTGLWNPHCRRSLIHFRLGCTHFSFAFAVTNLKLQKCFVLVQWLHFTLSNLRHILKFYIKQRKNNELKTWYQFPDHVKDCLFIGFDCVRLSAVMWNPNSCLDLEQHAEIYMLAESSSRRRQ